MHPYILTTARLGLRKWAVTDLGPLAAMNSDETVMQYFPKTLSKAESTQMLERLSTHFTTHGFGFFAVDLLQTGEFIGFTGLAIPAFESFFTPCVEIGWRFKKAFWGQGYATEAASACLAHGFGTLKLGKIVSFTSIFNLPSEKVMQRIGMEIAGTFDHPLIEKSSELCRHVLYEISSTTNSHPAPGS